MVRKSNQYFNTIIVILTVLVFNSCDCDLMCPSGWITAPISNSCLYGNKSQKGDYETASKHCRQFNGSLVTLNSPEEAHEISSLLNNIEIPKFMFEGKTYTHTISNSDSNSINMTTTSTTISTFETIWGVEKVNNYTNWAPNQPQCRLPVCCIVKNSKSQWVNVNCALYYPIVCQKRITQMVTVKYGSGQEKDDGCTIVLDQIESHLRLVERKLETQSSLSSKVSHNSTDHNKSATTINGSRKDESVELELLVNLISELRNLMKPFGHIDNQSTNSFEDSGTDFQLKSKADFDLFSMASDYSITGIIVLLIIITFLVVLLAFYIHRKSSSSRDQRKPEKLILSPEQWPSRCSDAAYD